MCWAVSVARFWGTRGVRGVGSNTNDIQHKPGVSRFFFSLPPKSIQDESQVCTNKSNTTPAKASYVFLYFSVFFFEHHKATHWKFCPKFVANQKE